MGHKEVGIRMKTLKCLENFVTRRHFLENLSPGFREFRKLRPTQGKLEPPGTVNHAYLYSITSWKLPKPSWRFVSVTTRVSSQIYIQWHHHVSNFRLATVRVCTSYNWWKLQMSIPPPPYTREPAYQHTHASCNMLVKSSYWFGISSVSWK